MKGRTAILDLGTNTFHLIIIDPGEKGYAIVHKSRVFVKLAEQGSRIIGKEAFARGMDVLKAFREEVSQFRAESVFAFATASLRNPSNAGEFIFSAKREAGFDIKVISGTAEAELIFHGVKQAADWGYEPVLVMDIGGGSVEFIIAESGTIRWTGSYPAGAAILKNMFHANDPVTEAEVSSIREYLSGTLQELTVAAGRFGIKKLTGASGSFDTICEMILRKKEEDADIPVFSRIRLEDYREVRDLLIRSTLQERLGYKGLVPMRAEMIVVAVLLIDFVVDQLGIEEISVSSYSLKEGVAWCLVNGKLSATIFEQ